MLKKFIFLFTFICTSQIVFSNDLVITHVSPNTTPMEINQIAFKDINDYYGHIGRLFYAFLTHQNALGNEMSKVSKVIERTIGIDNYTNGLKMIYENSQKQNLEDILSNVYEKVKDIAVPETRETFEEAVTICLNIFNDENKVDEIIRKMIQADTAVLS